MDGGGSRTRRGGSGRRRLRLAAVLSLAAAAFTPPEAAFAHPFDIFGFGSRAIAMGGAFSTVADDFTASYYNPAGLTRSKSLSIGMGYGAILSSLELNGEGFDLSDADFSGVSGGLSASRDVGGNRVGFGIGFSLPDQAAVRTRLLSPVQPSFVLLSDRTQRGETNFAGAVRLFPWLSVGGGVAVAADLDGSIRIEGNLFPQDLGGRLVVDIRSRLYPVGGILVQPSEGLRLGVSYRGEMRVKVRIPMEAAITVTDGTTEPVTVDMVISQTHFFSPQQVTLGVSYEPAPEWTLSFDLVWENWSAKERAKIDSSAPESDPLVEPAFHDVVTPRAGVEYRANLTERLDLAVRAGYVFEPSPVPTLTGVFNYLDNDKHVASAGLGIGFTDSYGILASPMTLDVHVQYMKFAQRHYHKEDLNDPVGDLEFGGERLGLGAILTFHY